MALTDVFFEVIRLLWVIFLFAASVAIWLMAVGRGATARRIVFGEIVLTLALVFLGAGIASSSGTHAADWDMLGMFLFGLNALFVAGGTAAILLVMLMVRKARETPEE